MVTKIYRLWSQQKRQPSLELLPSELARPTEALVTFAALGDGVAGHDVDGQVDGLEDLLVAAFNCAPREKGDIG